MAILSSSLLLRTHSLSLLTISFYLVFWPAQLLNSTPVWLLGEAMNIRPASFAPDDSSTSPSSSLSSQPPPPPIMPGARQRNAPLPGGAGAGAGAGVGGFRPPSFGGAALASSGNSAAGGLTAAGMGIQQDQGTRELYALLALLVVVYAVTQFIFAGDLTLLASPSSGSSTSNKSNPSSKSSSSKNQSSSSSSSSSRYGEELHTLYTAQSRWLTLAGVRVLGSSGLVFWIYMFHSHGKSSLGFSGGEVARQGLALLANRVTFTLALSDMLFWGYLWTVLKDEGRQVAVGVARRREEEGEKDEED